MKYRGGSDKDAAFGEADTCGYITEEQADLMKDRIALIAYIKKSCRLPSRKASSTQAQADADDMLYARSSGVKGLSAEVYFK